MVIRPCLFKLMRKDVYRLRLPSKGHNNSSGNTANPANQKDCFLHLVDSPGQHWMFTGKFVGCSGKPNRC